MANSVFVFDSSPVIAGCSFQVAGSSVAELLLGGTDAWIPPAVYNEVVRSGGTRPDAVEAGRLVRKGQLRLADATDVGSELSDLQHYALGSGDKEAITLASRIPGGSTVVTDDFLVLIVAARLQLPHQLFLDFLVGQAERGIVSVALAKQAVQVLRPTLSKGVCSSFTCHVGWINTMTTVSIPVPDELAPVIKPALDRDPAKGGEWLRLGFEARLTELYKDWQAMRISTSRFAELLGINMWELNDLLNARGLKLTNLPG